MSLRLSSLNHESPGFSRGERQGGTLRAGELAFDDNDVYAEDASFRDDETTRRYMDTAICKNIQHSLDCCKDGQY